MDSSRDQIDLVRDFNRYYTHRLGLLTDSYLGQNRPLSEARLLFEIGQRRDIRDLRAQLGLDSGYLSRLLRSLTREGLVRVVPSPEDGRVRVAELTAAGVAERHDLDQRARAGVGEWLEHLTAAQRNELVGAQERIRLLLRPTTITVDIVNSDDLEDARRCLHAYAAEIDARFPEGYDSAELIDPAELTGDTGTMLVAHETGQPVGCVLWNRLGPDLAEVRHLWVAKGSRGLGLARRLLRRLEADAAAHGILTLRLYTHRVLPEANALYRSSGYREIPSYADSRYSHFAFEKTL